MQGFQATILRFDSLASTNDELASQAAAGAAEGLCIVAGEQTAGRGRLQRQWSSPAGAGLYLSVLLRPKVAPQLWTLLPLLAALAVHDALLSASNLETDIKWPNDILWRGRKLCGILAETIETNPGRAVVLGIGINLNNNAFPPELANTATSIAAACGRPDAEELLQTVVRALAARYAELSAEDGPGKLRREWLMRSSYGEGKRVRISNGGDVLEGITRGLESDGALRLETESGELKIVRAGDVTNLRPVAPLLVD